MAGLSLIGPYSSFVVAPLPALSGFKHKELRGKLAIGITANFVNRNTAAEAQVAEISGVARIYNQKFFQDLLTETGIGPRMTFCTSQASRQLPNSTEPKKKPL